jgi:hypothetical protein
MNPEFTNIVYGVPAPQPTSPITYTPPPMYIESTSPPMYVEKASSSTYVELTPSPTYVEKTPISTIAINNDNINNLYINVQDYLDILNSLYDKTKDTFISVNTVLENMKPFIYKKTNNN